MYIYRNNHGAASTLVVAGDVIPEGTTVTLATFPGANAYKGFGNPLPMNVDLDTNDLTLNADGFNALDVVLEYNSGWFTYAFNGSTYGFDLTAGRSYVMRTQGAFTWDYTIPTGALASTTAPVKVAKAAKSADLN
jgi:hypothetical protein